MCWKVCYFRPFLAAFFSSISCFLARRFGDLYGRGLVFFFGLNAMIRVIWALLYINFGCFGRGMKQASFAFREDSVTSH